MNFYNTETDNFYAYCLKRIANPDVTWEILAKEYNERFNDYICGHVLRKRCNRYKNNASRNGSAPSNTSLKNIAKTALSSSSKVKEVDTFDTDGNGNISMVKAISKTNLPDKKHPNDILELFGYDTTQWEITKYRESNWSEDKVAVQLSIRPKTNVPSISTDDILRHAMEVFSENIEPYHYQKIDKAFKELDDNKLIMFPPIEAHIGKISDAYGEKYNRDIAIGRINKTFDNFISLQEKERAKSCLIVIGSDFFNCEYTYTTSHGTPQPCCDLEQKNMVMLGFKLYDTLFRNLPKYFDNIYVLPAPGNHAYNKERELYFALQCRFGFENPEYTTIHFNDILEADTDKSFRFGNNLLMFEHGDGKVERMYSSLPYSYGSNWDAKYKYLFMGHLHKHDWKFTENGVLAIRVPAICENDAWHRENYFGVNNEPQHEFFVFDKKYGMDSTHIVHFDRQ